MDVRTTPSSPGPRARRALAFLIDRGRAQVDPLQSEPRALPPPDLAQKAGFDLLLGESPSTFTPDQRGHLLTMVSLCDDLLRLTRSYLDYAGIVQGSRPALPGFIHGRRPDRRNRPPVRPGRRVPTDQVGVPRGVSRDRGRHRRLTLPANLRQSRLERPEIHASGRSSARDWESRGRFLVGDRLRLRTGHSRRGPRQGLRAVLPLATR